ncbi:MAG: hypothetical protein ABJM37_08455 [Gilvibacter sp.]
MLTIKTQVSFRFLNLNKLQGITLTREVTGATYHANNTNGRFTGCVALTGKLDNINDLNVYFVRQQVILDDCDILITVTSQNRPSKIEVPMLVNKLLRHIDCKITIALTPE